MLHGSGGLEHLKYNSWASTLKLLGHERVDVLKMDIEGNEYNILDDIIQNQKNMIGMVIEFHSCDLMSEKIKLFIEKLSLDLVHIHVNNYGPVTKDRFPTVIELTFSAKKYNLKREENENNFPVESFDQPNNKNDQNAPISFI
mgnify:CR=1 FL=1